MLKILYPVAETLFIYDDAIAQYGAKLFYQLCTPKHYTACQISYIIGFLPVSNSHMGYLFFKIPFPFFIDLETGI